MKGASNSSADCILGTLPQELISGPKISDITAGILCCCLVRRLNKNKSYSAEALKLPTEYVMLHICYNF